MGKRSGKGKRQRLNVPKPVVPTSKTTQFSFKYLDRQNNQFPITGCPQGFWTSLMDCLHRYSQIIFDDFIVDDYAVHRHEVDFAVTCMPNGFAHLDEEIQTAVPYQFEVGEHQGWRIIGFILDETFFIVWLDSDHRLYPKGRN